jgi:hypothetical protein
MAAPLPSARMTYNVRLDSTDEGDYLARCDDPPATARGLSPASALDQLRAELRYQLEMCPCHGVDPSLIQFDVTA